MRKLGRPPRLIRQMMDCVLILFGRPLRNPIKIDPELQGAEPSWDCSLRVNDKILEKIFSIISLLAHVRYWFSSKSSSLST